MTAKGSQKMVRNLQEQLDAAKQAIGSQAAVVKSQEDQIQRLRSEIRLRDGQLKDKNTCFDVVVTVPPKRSIVFTPLSSPSRSPSGNRDPPVETADPTTPKPTASTVSSSPATVTSQTHATAIVETIPFKLPNGRKRSLDNENTDKNDTESPEPKTKRTKPSEELAPSSTSALSPDLRALRGEFETFKRSTEATLQTLQTQMAEQARRNMHAGPLLDIPAGEHSHSGVLPLSPMHYLQLQHAAHRARPLSRDYQVQQVQLAHLRLSAHQAHQAQLARHTTQQAQQAFQAQRAQHTQQTCKLKKRCQQEK
ncbi:MAG: hypothetical protein LQ343_001211 [Gyalolechia ehrenbergii]|nr:MAG: hypothetical protein LQ343_001211 [Gyalolechia ehrenbergii]